MMKIPTEELQKYNVSINHLDDERGTYATYLRQTDWEIIKGFESLLAEPTKFLSNLAALAKTLKDVIKYRQIAREELENIE